MTDPGDLYRTWLDQWRRFLVAPPVAAASPAWSSALDRFFTAQSALQNLGEASLRAWSELLPKAQAGQDWAAASGEQTRRFREQLLGPAAGDEDPERLWQRYLDDLGRLGAPFAEALERLPAAFRDAAPFGRLTELVWESVGAATPRSPGLGPGREFAEKVSRAFEAWLEMSRAATAYQAIIADTWTQACERYVRELASRAEQGATPPGQRELVTLFLELADAVFTERFLTEEYVQAQARAGNATMTYLARERDLVDAVAKFGHFPTRTETDEAYRQIHELRRELRELRAEVRRLHSREQVS